MFIVRLINCICLLFTTAKPFEGHIGIIQRNAFKSWMLLDRDVEIILFGDEDGAAEICTELDIRHEPYVERFESKYPYVNFMFARAQEIAKHEPSMMELRQKAINFTFRLRKLPGLRRANLDKWFGARDRR
jgi:hypothetical protein